MTRSFLSLLALVAVSAAASIPRNLRSEISPRAAARDNSGLSPGCENTPTSRKCWGEYDINTNPYDNVFYTGRTVEYWLNIEEIDCAPDGYQRKCMVANGTMPGPAIVADWGDNIIVHVTNNVPTNGTSIHWHGMRQLNNNQYDGAPGVTQCPLAPGQSMSYKFHASQYGTAMYHSHFSVQYSMGLYGPLVINGPATADYDEDLGTVFMNDWGHETEFYRWATVDNFNVSFEGAPTGLVNGMNTGNCTLVNATNPDPLCVGKGKKFELAFEAGKKYRIRFINLATEAWFHPSIDGHNMTVISNDLVPIVPYETDGVLINMGQRYDVIVEANAVPGDYWFRSGFIAACIPNGNADGITGIVRYNKNSTAEPTTVSTTPQIDTCLDEPTSRLVPWVPITVPNMRGGLTFSNVTGEYFQGKFLRWSFNKPSGGFLLTNWSQPALGDVYDNEMTNIPVTNNIFTVGTTELTSAANYNKSSEVEWAVFVLDEVTPIPGPSHPMHLHGHDYLLLYTGPGKWDGTTKGWQLDNPPRRDTAIMHPNGYFVMAWPLDNPGIWLLHCHVAWHSSQGFGMTLLESPGLINALGASSDWNSTFTPMCEKWHEYEASAPFHQDDSGV